MLPRLFGFRRSSADENKELNETASTKANILIVDDDPHLRQLIRLTLQSKGYAVREGQDGSEVPGLVREFAPDLIVLDGNMPTVDGFEVLKQLRMHRATAKTPVIMLTMRSHQVDMLTGYRYGAQEYLTKPIALEQLVVSIRRLLGKG